MECPYCGVQLNDDGTVDALDGQSDTHFADCGATFTVEEYDRDWSLIAEHLEAGRRPWDHYGPARDFMAQKRAMSGPAKHWRIV